MKNYVTLGDVCKKGSSNIAQKDIENNNGTYAIYGASGYIKDVDFYHQDKPYIAVVKDGAGIGRTMLLPEKTSVIGTLQYLIPSDLISVKYLYYAVTSMHLSKYFTGATIPHIYFKDYQKELLPLPPMEKQQEIAEALEKADTIIKLYNSILEKMDELAKSRFVEMFGDVTREEYRYEIHKLGDVSKVGSSHRVFTTEFVEQGIPFYRGTEIGELANGNIPQDTYKISEAHYQRLIEDGTKPQFGDLLMPSICNKGQVWMVNTEEPFYYKDGRVLSISPDRDIFNPKYLQYYMKTKTEIEYPKLGSGSTFAEFKIFQIKEMDVLIPPKDVQDFFASFVEQIDKSKTSAQKALEETQILFNSQMQQYFDTRGCKK